MTNRRSGRVPTLACALALGFCAISARPLAAQSTIFNIPTTDTVSPKKGYFEFDYLLQAPAPDAGKFQIFTPRIVVGVTPQLEVGANFANTNYSDGGGTYSQVQPNAKFKFYSDDKGLAAAAGVILYAGVNNDQDSFSQIYANVSKKLPGDKGPRLTAGAYAAVSYAPGNTGGVLLGYEQPLTPKVSFVADFLSGKNFWGYFTPGVSFTLPRNGLLLVGYALGNDSYDSPSNNNRALFVYYGITFP